MADSVIQDTDVAKRVRVIVEVTPTMRERLQAIADAHGWPRQVFLEQFLFEIVRLGVIPVKPGEGILASKEGVPNLAVFWTFSGEVKFARVSPSVSDGDDPEPELISFLDTLFSGQVDVYTWVIAVRMLAQREYRVKFLSK